MKKYLRILGHLLVCAIFVLAIYLLYVKLKDYSIAQIKASINQISWARISLSMLLMAINYIILIGYDWLALKAIHKNLPLGKVSLVSFVGQAVSYNFGALLGGTSVRYRFYTAWGFSITDMVRLVLMLAVTFWVGVFGLCGIVFIFWPPVMPEALMHGMPIKDLRILGGILAALSFAYLALCFGVRKPVHIFKKEFVFPAPKIAVAQCIVAYVDIIAACACLWVLLPGDIGVSYLQFLPGYLLAMVAVVLTHIPGGVGIFELIILELSHTTHEQSVFAAVLLFRLIYYIIPLLLAAVLLAVYEARQQKDTLKEAGRWLSVLSHSIAAYLSFAGGLILLVSATLPTAWKGLPEIMQNWPYWLLGIGHMTCALSGAGLLFVASGLEGRQSSAFRITIFLFITGIFGALLKGFSWEAASMAAIILLAICLAHKRFYRSKPFFEGKFPLNWLGAAFAVLALVFMLGWFLYHPAWDRAATWGFERPMNASRTLTSFAAIAVMLFLAFMWRFWLRVRKPDKNKNS